ncbi:MAG TPA: type II toxin-antitoxin system prevent-host-death family antitoxin [bacterium]
MAVTASTLRQNIYRLLDRIIQTGHPLEIERKGKLLKIVPVEPQDKLKRLKRRNTLKCDPEELVHLDWSKEWKA